MKKISNDRDSCIIVPAFNEEERLGKVLILIKKYHKNIIVVDDGSKDKTFQVAKNLNVMVLRHDVNLGKGAAMKTGVEAAIKKGFRKFIFIDADGQHEPSEIPNFLDELEKGYGIVFGTRRFDVNVPLLRLLGNKFGSVIVKLLFNIYRSDLLCGFFAFNLNSYKKIKWDSCRYGVETEIVARTGKNKLKYSEVSIKAIYIDKHKGVTLLDAVGVLFNIPRWLR